MDNISNQQNNTHSILGLEDERFVYNPSANNDSSSRFEAFMSVTNEKKLLAQFIGSQLKTQTVSPDQMINIIDIGSGTGELITKSIAESGLPSNVFNLRAIEPATNLLEALPKNILRNNLNNLNFTGYPVSFEDFQTNTQADMVLASHLYHLKGQEYQPYLRKMADLLYPTGKILFVYRSQEMDDLRRFRLEFTPKILNQTYTPRDISSVMPFIDEVINENGLKKDIQTITSNVDFQNTDEQTKKSALEFILNINFENYKFESTAIWMKQIGQFLRERNNTLTNKQDAVVISR